MSHRFYPPNATRPSLLSHGSLRLASPSLALAASHDTLLPKLLSGELSVAALESKLAGADAESATVQTGKPAP